MEEGKRRGRGREKLNPDFCPWVQLCLNPMLTAPELLWSQGILLPGLGSQALGSIETQ